MTSSLEGKGGGPKDDMWWHDDTGGEGLMKKCPLFIEILGKAHNLKHI